jgi:hypothetical protein
VNNIERGALPARAVNAMTLPAGFLEKVLGDKHHSHYLNQYRPIARFIPGTSFASSMPQLSHFGTFPLLDRFFGVMNTKTYILLYIIK